MDSFQHDLDGDSFSLLHQYLVVLHQLLSFVCFSFIRLFIAVKFPMKGEAEIINATPMVKEENENENEKQTKPDFRLDLSIFKESLRVPTNWIGRR